MPNPNPISFYHGVTVSVATSGGRTIAAPSSSVIGVVAPFTPAAGLADPNVPVLITTPNQGVAQFGAGSPMTDALAAIFAEASPLVVAIGVAAGVTDADTLAALAGINAATRTGIQALLDAASTLGYRPRLIIAPGWSSHATVASELISVATKLGAMAILDGPNTTDADAVTYAGTFGGQRAYMVDPAVVITDPVTGGPLTLGASASTAGLIAATDANIGWWASPSDQAFLGVIGTSRPIDYNYGDTTCRAQLLNNALVATVVNDGGYRLWGNRTLSGDPKWSFITRVRSVDMIGAAIQSAQRFITDKGITPTYVHDVTEMVADFMRSIRKRGGIIDFSVAPDPDLNTDANIENGKIYWRVRFTDVPPAENPNFVIEVTNQWISEVLAPQAA